MLAEMEELKDEHIAAYTRAIACSSDENMLTDIIVERLENKSQRSAAMLDFIAGKKSRKAGRFDREMATYLRRALSKDAIRKVFDKYGRAVEIDGYYLHWSD